MSRLKFRSLFPTGSLNISGSVTATQFIDSAGNPVITSAQTSSFSSGISSLNAETGSYLITGSVSGNVLTLEKKDGTTFNLTVDTGSASTRLDSIESETGSYATTGSNQFIGDQNITGDLTVTGTLTAQEYHSEFVSASIIYESGSTKFGDTADDNHAFTGSLGVSGSITAVDISIDDWGSVSSSLAEISASAAAANSITLQGVTDNGSLTTNHISISSSLNVSQSIISKGEDVLDFAVAMAIALG